MNKKVCQIMEFDVFCRPERAVEFQNMTCEVCQLDEWSYESPHTE